MTMTALWISLAVVAVALLVWRLQRANRLLGRILREEREVTEREAALPAESAADDPVQHRNG
jgi:hypothetical protein